MCSGLDDCTVSRLNLLILACGFVIFFPYENVGVMTKEMVQNVRIRESG